MGCTEFSGGINDTKIVGSKTVLLLNARHMTFADQTAIFVNAVDRFVNGKTN